MRYKTLMMIEPIELPAECVVDGLTRRGVALLRGAKAGMQWSGYHVCVCGAISGDCDLIVTIDGQEFLTNSLIAHYLAYHRPEVPPGEMTLIESLSREVAPIPPELVPPLQGVRAICDWPETEELIRLAANPKLFTIRGYFGLERELARRGYVPIHKPDPRL